jgi:hypothetical protein
MGREVNATQPYTDKLVKLIPTEIVGAYMVLAGILSRTGTNSPTKLQPTVPDLLGLPPESDLKIDLTRIVFFFLLVLTPFYLRRVGRVTNISQLCISTLSFGVLVYTLGGPFVDWGIYHPLIGSVILVLWSLSVPLVVNAETDAPTS